MEISGKLFRQQVQPVADTGSDALAFELPAFSIAGTHLFGAFVWPLCTVAD
jgi:hypothetical protein